LLWLVNRQNISYYFLVPKRFETQFSIKKIPYTQERCIQYKAFQEKKMQAFFLLFGGFIQETKMIW
jgi:hypothetical protein